MAKFKVGDLIEIDPVSARKIHPNPDEYIERRTGLVLKVLSANGAFSTHNLGEIVEIPTKSSFKLGRTYYFNSDYWKLKEDEFDDLDRSLDI